MRGDIDRFDRYVMDVDIAVTWASTQWPDTPIFVLGESMGASIAIQYVTRGMYQTNHITLSRACVCFTCIQLSYSSCLW